MAKTVRRLYESFHPESYELSLSPDRETMTSSGFVTIKGQKVNRPSQRLVFHQVGLKISEARITYHDKKGDYRIEVDRINHHANYDEVRLHSKKLLYPGRYTIVMQFSGSITRPMNGIYPCYFKNKGLDETIIATQFESHHAREAFPCIDEPEAKAVFQLELFTPKDLAVISNTPALETKEVGNLLRNVFEPTPRMSSYLLAFVYGNLEYKEAKTKNGTFIRTYATPANVAFTEFALDVAVRCLEFYEKYFDIDYPLPKCDLVGLPDFAAGAMENWGCITFREQTLLVDPANTSLSLKQYVAMVVAHELAHQWFGNLVTMEWWTDLWLNEGFASWIEYLAVNELFPDWQMWTQFSGDETRPALSLDALANTHPIEVPIKHPDEIATIFDAISYSKGASVIHMLHNYLGAEVFKVGLRNYLKKHAYANAGTKDLWAALETSAKRPVGKFMESWTTKPGFPIVHSEIGSHSLLLKQERFYINKPADQNRDDQTIWPIPLLAGSSILEILDQAQSSEVLTTDKFLKLNIGQTGFYRVIYDNSQIVKLGNAVASSRLKPVDRVGILSDALEAAKAGYQPATVVLRLLASYDHEDNAAVWEIIADVIGSIRRVMDDDKVRELMKPYVRKLVAMQLKRLGWNEKSRESHFDRLLRPIILGLAASADEPTVLNEVNRRFNSAKLGSDIKPDLRGVIYATVARRGGQKDFDKLLKLHNASESSEERLILSAALSSFEKPELFKTALELIDSDSVRLQDASYWIAYSFGNRFARETTWLWMTSHWKWLEKNLGKDLSFYRFPLYSARSFSDDKFLDVYKKFFKKVWSPVLDRAINQGIETIEWQSAWRKRDLDSLIDFFSK